jgi:hypothetical protein
MKKKPRSHQPHREPAQARRRSLVWIVLGVTAVAAVAALAVTPWVLRTLASGMAAQETANGELQQRTAELIGYARSIALTPEEEGVKAEALSGITMPCANRNTLAVRCCSCNLSKSITGLANHLIAREGADVARVRQAVLDWISQANPGGWSGAACERKRCERPFREDGCGGMKETRLVF